MVLFSKEDMRHCLRPLPWIASHTVSQTPVKVVETDRSTVWPDEKNRVVPQSNRLHPTPGIHSRVIWPVRRRLRSRSKWAQEQKPGEGGHLPGKKVSMDCQTRLSTPRRKPLTPCHHITRYIYIHIYIYLFQWGSLNSWSFDLKECKPRCKNFRKLFRGKVSVPAKAAGVAKVGAQVVPISGYDAGR